MINLRIRLFLPAALMLLALFTSGCVGNPKPIATSLQEVEQDEVIVVGKIVFDPPLEEGEQTLKTASFTGGGLMINPTAAQYRNKVILLTGNQNRRITDPSLGDYKDRIEAELGQTFYVRAKKEPFYVVRSEILMNLDEGGMKKALLPSGYRIDIRPGDQAVYIGTIKYYRDEFFSTKRVEIIDEFKKEAAKLKKKFGDSIRVRKAMAAAAE